MLTYKIVKTFQVSIGLQPFKTQFSVLGEKLKLGKMGPELTTLQSNKKHTVGEYSVSFAACPALEGKMRRQK